VVSERTGSPAERAFLVQLDQLESSSRGDDDEAAGRVEHIRSGEASRFASVRELIAFMGRVLDEHDATASGEPDA
jgi:hypothetical protein